MDQAPDLSDDTDPSVNGDQFTDVNAEILALFEDIPAADRLTAGRSFYFDAAGAPRLRRTELRAVRGQ